MKKGAKKAGKKVSRSLVLHLLKQLERRFPNQITFHDLQLMEEADSESLSLSGKKLTDAASIEEVLFIVY